MLGFGRLFRYEFKAVGRVMFPLYGALIASSIIFGFSNLVMSDGGAGEIVSVTSAILYGLMVMAVVALTAVMLIQRFYKNLMGNEGYLAFTLPVSTNAHIGTKTLSASVWMLLGCAAGILSVLVIVLFMVTPAELVREMGFLWDEISRVNGVNVMKVLVLIVEAILIGAVWCGEVAVKIYAAISLGQQWSNHRVMGAVGAYIGFSIIESIVGGILQAILPDNFPYSICSGLSDYAGTQVMMLIVFLAELVLVAIYWFVTYRLLDRRLNLQ
ncbi:MAG: hypothetical protein MR991_05590 [Clostridiales bacterium]|nr:hypothetical protein [Clostridiales bacterium]MDD7035177.1 hypothetical protein [Bacillota bacterium]MDY2920023.1 hypothetical protein [Lentihominibacter sp.]